MQFSILLSVDESINSTSEEVIDELSIIFEFSKINVESLKTIAIEA
jgi:hypothetical protein